MKSRLAYIGVAFILSFGLFPALTFAETNLSGTISSDRTLTVAESPYIVYTPITVAEGATLSIDPGVIIKFWQNGAIWVYGSLLISGTENNKVYLTSLDDDLIGGDTNNDGSAAVPTPWHGITFFINSTGTISNLDIQYAGTYNQNSGWAAVANMGTLTLSDSLFTKGPASYGFRQMYGTSTITNTEFGEGIRQAIGIEGGVSDITQVHIHNPTERALWVKNSTVHLVDSVLEHSEGETIAVQLPATFTHGNNQYLNNLRNGISMWGTMGADAVIRNDNNIPYLFDKVTVPSGKTLTVDPGAVIKFYDNGNVLIEGVMNVIGTKENPVHITSWYDDSVAGDTNGDGNATVPLSRKWQSIAVLPGGSLVATHADVAYGGGQGYFYTQWPAIGNTGGTILLDTVAVRDSNVGVYNSEGETTIQNSILKDNYIGAYLAYGSLTIHNSSLVGNDQGAGTSYGLTNTVDATDNWWGSESGPSHYTNNPTGTGDGVADRVNFTPWLTSEPGTVTPPVETCCSSVLFLPGLEASRLYKLKTILGVSIEDQLWEPNIPTDVEDLYLNSNGTSLNEIFTKDVVGKTNILGPLSSLRVYQSLIDKLDSLVLENKILKWEPYAYDWRQGIEDLVENGTAHESGQVFSLIGTLQSLADSSKNGKVSIIAHSNGGLLGKALIRKLEEQKSLGQSNLIDKVENLVLVASPQLGTPDALSSILHGYRQNILNGFIMDEVRARKMAANMPSAYGLLPSQKYFEQSGISTLGVFSTSSPSLYKTAYGSDINNYQEERSFVLGEEGRSHPSDSNLIDPIKGNGALLARAEVLHNVIDNMTFPPSLNVVSVAGWGKSTVAGITYADSDIQPIFTIRGDQTVVIPSALYGQGSKYWLDLSNSKLKHANILEDTQLLNFLGDIIEQKSVTSSGLKNTEPTQVGNRLHLSVHSPVSIGVYDNQNNFTGKVCDTGTGQCAIQEDVPGSSYFEFGEGKYVSLGQDKVQKIKLQGTDIGTFTLNSEVIAPSGHLDVSSFVDIPVTTQTQGELIVNSQTNIPNLTLDVTGDGVIDFTLDPSSNFDPVMYLQIMKATVSSLDLSQVKISVFNKRIDAIIKSIQKGKIEKAKLRADKFKVVLEKKLTKADPRHPKIKKLSKTDAQLLLDMLNKLLDNLS